MISKRKYRTGLKLVAILVFLFSRASISEDTKTNKLSQNPDDYNVTLALSQLQEAEKELSKLYKYYSDAPDSKEILEKINTKNNEIKALKTRYSEVRKNYKILIFYLEPIAKNEAKTDGTLAGIEAIGTEAQALKNKKELKENAQVSAFVEINKELTDSLKLEAMQIGTRRGKQELAQQFELDLIVSTIRLETQDIHNLDFIKLTSNTAEQDAKLICEHKKTQLRELAIKLGTEAGLNKAKAEAIKKAKEKDNLPSQNMPTLETPEARIDYTDSQYHITNRSTDSTSLFFQLPEEAKIRYLSFYDKAFNQYTQETHDKYKALFYKIMEESYFNEFKAKKLKELKTSPKKMEELSQKLINDMSDSFSKSYVNEVFDKIKVIYPQFKTILDKNTDTVYENNKDKFLEEEHKKLTNDFPSNTQGGK